MTRLIEEGDQVLLKRDNNAIVFQVKKGRKLQFDKAKFTLDGVIGQPFGGTFQVTDGEMVRISDPDEVINDLMKRDAGESSGKDNRDLVGATSNQKLSQDDIQKMKDGGLSGEGIIQELISNSETFKNKTEYSQKKYLKKKIKKHVFIFTVLKPSARLLIDMVYTKCPHKICNLRIDSLSQILAYANIMSGVRVAVVDTLQGLVVGSVMERMGGCGKVVQFYPGSDLNRQVLNFFDFPKSFKDNLYSYALNRLPELKSDRKDNTGDLSETSTSDKTDCPAMEDDKGGNSDIKDTPAVDAMSVDEVKETNGKRKADSAQNESDKANKAKIAVFVKDLIREKDFDCLIVACKFHPTPIVFALLEYVAPSRPVVVYSAAKEPLLDCYTCLKKSGRVLNVRLTESWYRQYQVLPNQTHPTMQMTGTGGYLLTCTTITS